MQKCLFGLIVAVGLSGYFIEAAHQGRRTASAAQAAKVDLSHHTDNIVFSCVDYRFANRIAEWIDKDLKTSDHIAVAGSGKCITNEASRAFMVEQVRLLIRLHGVKQLHIVEHLDCGGYGGAQAFASPKKELEAHVAELRKAAKVLKEALPPEIQVHYYVIALEDAKPKEVVL